MRESIYYFYFVLSWLYSKPGNPPEALNLSEFLLELPAAANLGESLSRVMLACELSLN